jgi:hypothetical protein
MEKAMATPVTSTPYKFPVHPTPDSELSPREKTQLNPVIGDSYIDTAGKKITIINDAELKDLTDYLAKDCPLGGVFIFKAATAAGNSNPTTYFQSKDGIDILQDGGNFTDQQNDDLTAQQFSPAARAKLKRDMEQSANPLQANAVQQYLNGLHASDNTDFERMHRSKAEVIIYRHLKEAGKDSISSSEIDTAWKALDTKFKSSNGLNKKEMELYEAYGRMNVDLASRKRFDTDADGSLSLDEIDSAYRDQTGLSLNNDIEIRTT